MIPNELKSMKPMSGKERLGAFRDSEYLGAEDIEPGTEPVLTIKALYNGMINQVRPLVVNSTNRKTLRKLFHAVSAEALVGKKIQLFLQPGVRDPSTGDKVDGIRIRDKVPTGKAYTAPKCSLCKKDIVGVSGFTAEQIAANTKQKYGKQLCVECGQKKKAEMEAAEKAAQLNATAQETAVPAGDDLAAKLMADAGA